MSPVWKTGEGATRRDSPAGIARPTALKGRQSNGVVHAGSVALVGGTKLAALIKSKKVSAKEAATAALARLDAVNPKINAVVDHKPAEVLAEAAAIDAEDRPR